MLIKHEQHQRSLAPTDLTALCSPGQPVRARPVRRKAKPSIRAAPVPKPAPSANNSGIPSTAAVASGGSSKKAKIKKRSNKQRADRQGASSCNTTRPQSAPSNIPATAAKDARAVPSAHASVQTDQSVLNLSLRQKIKAKHPVPAQICRTTQPDSMTRKKLDEALHMVLSSKHSSAARSLGPGHMLPPAGNPQECPQDAAAHQVASDGLRGQTVDHTLSPSTCPAATAADQHGARAPIPAGPPAAVGMMANFQIRNHLVDVSCDHAARQENNRCPAGELMMVQYDRSRMCGTTKYCTLRPKQGVLHEACSKFQDLGAHPSCSNPHSTHVGVLTCIKK